MILYHRSITLLISIIGMLVCTTVNSPAQNTPSIVSTSLYQDATQKLSLPDIQKIDSLGLFKYLNTETSLGYSRDLTWIKVVISNPDVKNHSIFLRWKKPLTHLIHCYEMGKDSVRESISGYAVPDSKKEVISNAICFPVTLPALSTITCFLQVRSPYGKEVNISLVDRKQLDSDEKNYTFFAGGIIFSLIAISLYNMFLGISLRDTMYLNFVITNIGDTFAVAAMLGVMPLMLPFSFASSPILNAASIGLFGATTANFTIRFLKLKQHHKIWYWILVGIIAGEFIAIAHGTISYYIYDGVYNLIAPISLIFYPLTFAACIISYLQGNKDARYLLLGFLLLWFSTMTKTLAILGITPSTWLTANLVYIADVMESVFMSFALADRYNRLQHEKLQLEVELRTKDKDLSMLATNNKIRYNERMIFLSELQELAKNEVVDLQTKLKSLIFNLSQKLNSEGKIILRADNLQAINAEFEEKLKTAYPQLSQSDIELCGYIKLNMAIKEIAEMKHTTTAAIKMARYRLKGKLQLDKQKLDDFIPSNF